MQLVDYTTPTLYPAPRKSRPNRNETKYRCICSRCGNMRFLSRQAAEHAEAKDACLVCSNRVKGAKGFQAVALKYGEDFAYNLLREHRLTKPSSCEQFVMNVLDKNHIKYSREFPIKTEDGIVFYDFAFDNILIEVDGAYWHQKSERVERDAYKDALAAAHGFIIVRIKEAQLKDAEHLIYNALQDERYLAF